MSEFLRERMARLRFEVAVAWPPIFKDDVELTMVLHTIDGHPGRDADMSRIFVKRLQADYVVNGDEHREVGGLAIARAIRKMWVDDKDSFAAELARMEDPLAINTLGGSHAQLIANAREPRDLLTNVFRYFENNVEVQNGSK